MAGYRLFQPSRCESSFHSTDDRPRDNRRRFWNDNNAGYHVLIGDLPSEAARTINSSIDAVFCGFWHAGCLSSWIFDSSELRIDKTKILVVNL